jgi:hypothetical protein
MSLNLCVCAPRRAPPRPRAPPRGTQSASASGSPTPACAPEAAPPEAVRSPSAWSMRPRHVSSVQRARDRLSPCHPPIEQHVPPRRSPPSCPSSFACSEGLHARTPHIKVAGFALTLARPDVVSLSPAAPPLVPYAKLDLSTQNMATQLS